MNRQLADLRAGVNLDAGLMPTPLADPAGKEKTLMLEQPVGNAVIDQNVKARVKQYDLQHTARCGVLALDVPRVL